MAMYLSRNYFLEGVSKNIRGKYFAMEMSSLSTTIFPQVRRNFEEVDGVWINPRHPYLNERFCKKVFSDLENGFTVFYTPTVAHTLYEKAAAPLQKI